jgi:site-specific recombinase XerD
VTVIVPSSWPRATGRARRRPNDVPGGVGDRWDLDRVVTVVSTHRATIAMRKNSQARVSRGTRAILEWLSRFPGNGWQERWVNSGADRGDDFIATVLATSGLSDKAGRQAVQAGFRAMILLDVVRPSYPCIARVGLTSTAVLRAFRSPTVFALAADSGAAAGLKPSQIEQGLQILTKVVLHTGKGLEGVTAGDLREFGEWSRTTNVRGRFADGYYTAVELLRSAGIIGDDDALRITVPPQRKPQPSPTELVDRYRVQNPRIRALLIRYLTERQPSMDHSSLVGLASQLVKLFWVDIENHHPQINSLHLPVEVAEAWIHRVRFKADGTPRATAVSVLTRVRAFYLDLQQWALEDPSWVPWVAPSPVRARDTYGQSKTKRRVSAKMNQRTRERLPQLPALVEAAERYRADQAVLLKLVTGVAVGQEVIVDGVAYCKVQSTASRRYPSRYEVHPALIENLTTGERIDVVQSEDHAFWSWAVIETLRHTGVRVEELTELTHLAVVSYRLADTGELVPMLQIVPSKTDEERVLLISPELASVLASIVTRLRDRNGGTVPLVARYDTNERASSPPLPHLFQRRTGWRPQMISQALIQRFLTDTLRRAALVDRAGTELRFTPHDFRRMFATDAVTAGLPVHIVARLLGHRSLATTQAYLAVFDDDLVRTYRAFLSQRRATRSPAEYREPTAQEWQDFQQHFELRKVELGSCSRPYGSPCNHEHACIRCPMLRIDPRQKPRLMEITHNLTERISEAKANGWLGEVEGLQVSLHAAQDKLAGLNRQQPSATTGLVELGLPVIRDEPAVTS